MVVLIQLSREEVEEPLPPGPVLSQRDQALGALKALVQVLGPEKGSQVMGWWRGYCPRNQPHQFLPPPLMRRWWPAGKGEGAAGES